MIAQKIKIKKIKDLKEALKLKVKDPRQKHKITYKIYNIVIVTILAVLRIVMIGKNLKILLDI